MNRSLVLRYFDRHMSELVQGSSKSFVSRTYGAALRFGFNVLLARLLGAHGAGIYFLALTVTQLASVLAQFGLGNAVLRFVAADATADRWDKVASVYWQSLLLTGGVSLAVTGVISLGADFIARNLFNEPALTSALRLMVLSIPLFSLLRLHAELLRAIENIGQSVMLEGVGVPTVSILLLAALGRPLGVTGAVVAYDLTMFAILLLSIWLWYRATPQLRGRIGQFDFRLLLSTSLSMFWITLMDTVGQTADTALVGLWFDSDTVGIYGTAKRVALLTGFILAAINTAVAPQFAALYDRGEHRVLARLARQATVLATILALPVLLLFVTAPAQVLSIFGEEFTRGTTVLVILAIGQFISVAAGPTGYLLLMTGHEKLVSILVFMSLVLSVGLQIVLTPVWGTIGTAVAVSTSLAALNVALVLTVYRKLNFSVIAIPVRLGRKSG